MHYQICFRFHLYIIYVKKFKSNFAFIYINIFKVLFFNCLMYYGIMEKKKMNSYYDYYNNQKD